MPHSFRRGKSLARVVATAALAAGVCLLALPSTAAADTSGFFGVSMNRVFNDDPFDASTWPMHLTTARDDVGVRLARSDAFWEWVEPNPPQDGVHTYDWGLTDHVGAHLFHYGFDWLAILDYSPGWASAIPGDNHAPPANPADYAAYAGAFARRYGRGGELWDELPGLAYRPVTTYEIWNEPNGAWFWHTGPDPARYMELYVAARDAIKAVDPEARVLIGGLVPDNEYVRGLYAARSDAAEIIDGIAFHPYSRTPRGVLRHVRELRETVTAAGDGDVPIWITEVGWQTSGLYSPLVVPEETRAAYMREVADTLSRSDCGIDAFIPYTWKTPEQNPDDGEDWYGMFHPDGTHTPTSLAYADVVKNFQAPAEADRLPVCHPRPNEVVTGGQVEPDADGDGLGDVSEDPDDDNDGAPDAEDAFPLDARERADSDADGTGDNADADDDNDLVADALDAFPLDAGESADADLDGTGDNADVDDDGDRLPDVVETRRGSSPLDRDSDDDGLADGAERRTSPVRRDSDGDRLPDGLERGVTQPIADPPGVARGTGLRRFRPDAHPRSKTLATRRDTDRDGVADGREDRNRDGRRDRGERDPLRQDR